MRELVAKHQYPVLVNYGAATRPRGGVLPSREFGGTLVAWMPRLIVPTTRHAEAGSHRGHDALLALGLGALGVVFGDIGTSPLYAALWMRRPFRPS